MKFMMEEFIMHSGKSGPQYISRIKVLWRVLLRKTFSLAGCRNDTVESRASCVQRERAREREGAGGGEGDRHMFR